MAKLELLPAVDVRDGQAVRLVHGESGTETSYGSPLEAALAWQRAGAEWLHLVDLDAAFGTGDNRALIGEVTDAMDIKVELSGGIRDDATLAAALATGCTRVNLGTAALETPSGSPRSSPSTATRSRSASTYAVRPCAGAAGPVTAATFTRRWSASTRRAARGTSSRTSRRTARSRARTWSS